MSEMLAQICSIIFTGVMGTTHGAFKENEMSAL